MSRQQKRRVEYLQRRKIERMLKRMARVVSASSVSVGKPVQFVKRKDISTDE